MAKRTTKKSLQKKRSLQRKRLARRTLPDRRQYRNPPIIEAVCEFRFEPSQNWDATFPGFIFSKLRHLFPKRETGIHFRGTVETEVGAFSQKIEQLPEVRFVKKDDSAAVRLRPDQLSISQFPPYPTWNSFVPLIAKSFDVYQAIAKPKGITRIGLRYINTIEFEERAFRIEDFFSFYPFVGPEKLQTFSGFICGVILQFDEGRDALRMQTVSDFSGDPRRLSVTFDLDYYVAKPNALGIKHWKRWLSTAHDRIEEAFEGCITDKLRARFNLVK